jgi:spore photoproduct lyase
LTNFIKTISKRYHFTFQEQQILKTIETDLKQWGEKSLEEIWDYSLEKRFEGKKLRKELLSFVKSYHDSLRKKPTNYENFDIKVKPQKIKIEELQRKSLGFGACPVASEKTRCCNLLTLDAVESCGYDCSYCSIQSFYNEGKVVFDKDFKQKLDAIELDPNEFYHIGTGQSSDSLMWGNRYGVLDALVEFARKNPNVLLEFKTKSDNISYFLDKKDLPKNLLFTWSLNPQIVIDKEEHLTASLENRLQAARKIADIGMLVGFHFHPMIYIEDFEKHYGELFQRLKEMFLPKEVVLVSLGTLTFIKPVIKKIRSRDFKSRILQIPMENASGKLSYPLEIKEKMFSFAYQSLKEWHKDVYFYMCMEDKSLWKKVFGYEYPTNESFEMDMKLNYMKKVKGKF